MTALYQIEKGDEQLVAAAEAMAGEYEVPVEVMQAALEDFAFDELNLVLDNLRDKAQAEPRFFEKYAERKLTQYNNMRQYEGL